MQNITEENTTEELAEMRRRHDALNTEPNAEKFRAYWKKEGSNADILAATVESVVRGETAVSDEVIAECQAAVLRLNQIAHVLDTLSLKIGSNTDATSAALQIAAAHKEKAREAAYNLRIIVSWTEMPGTSNRSKQ